jgi:hypothetical protein
MSTAVIGRTLHEYDLELCNYAVGTVRQHFDDPAFAAALRRGLPEPLAQFIWADGSDDESNPLLLANDDFAELEEVLPMAP